MVVGAWLCVAVCLLLCMCCVYLECLNVVCCSFVCSVCVVAFLFRFPIVVFDVFCLVL